VWALNPDLPADQCSVLPKLSAVPHIRSTLPAPPPHHEEHRRQHGVARTLSPVLQQPACPCTPQQASPLRHRPLTPKPDPLSSNCDDFIRACDRRESLIIISLTNQEGSLRVIVKSHSFMPY